MSDPDPRNAEEYLPLKPLDFSVLLVLSQEELYGYAIVKRIAEDEAGGIRLAPSNLYHVLDRMVDAGLVEALSRETTERSATRQYYRPTELGRAVLMLEARRLAGVLGTARRLELLGGAGRP